MSVPGNHDRSAIGVWTRACNRPDSCLRQHYLFRALCPEGIGFLRHPWRHCRVRYAHDVAWPQPGPATMSTWHTVPMYVHAISTLISPCVLLLAVSQGLTTGITHPSYRLQGGASMIPAQALQPCHGRNELDGTSAFEREREANGSVSKRSCTIRPL